MGLASTILFYLCVVIFGVYLIAAEFLDTIGRLEVIEKRWPRMWSAMRNRPMRLVLLVLLIALVAKDLVERFRQGTTLSPVIVFKAPPGPIIETSGTGPRANRSNMPASSTPVSTHPKPEDHLAVGSVISDSQMQAMIETLNPLRGETVRIVCVGTQQQAQINCAKIKDVFYAAHWNRQEATIGNVIITSGEGSTSPVNISIIVPLPNEEPAKIVRQAFENGQIHASFQKAGFTGPGSLGPAPKVSIVIGPSTN